MTTNNAIDLSQEGVTFYDGVGNFSGIAPSVTTTGLPLVTLGGSLTAEPVFGTAVVAGGGTGSTSFLTNGIVVSGATGTTPLTATELTNGELLIGSTGAAAVATGLSAGFGISINTGPGNITISSTATGGGLTWQTQATSTTAAVNNGYIVTAGGVSIALPAGATVGEVVAVTSTSAVTSWTVTPNAGATISLGNQSTTTSLVSTHPGDSVYLVAETATQWIAIMSMGNITVT